MARADLRPGVDVEQGDVLQQIPCPVAHRVDDILSRHVRCDHQADVLEHRGKRRHPRRRQSGTDTDGVDIEFRRAGAPGQPRPLHHRGMELAGVADHPTVEHHLGTPARMPWQVLGRTQVDVDTGGTGDHTHGFEGIGCFDRPTRSPGSAGFTQPGQHHADMHGLGWQGLVKLGDLGIGRPAIGGDQPDGAGVRGGLHHLGDREQRDIAESPGHIAGQRFQ